jgi:hypothetical protein
VGHPEHTREHQRRRRSDGGDQELPSGPRMSARVPAAPPQKTSVTPRTGRPRVCQATAWSRLVRARMLAKSAPRRAPRGRSPHLTRRQAPVERQVVVLGPDERRGSTPTTCLTHSADPANRRDLPPVPVNILRAYRRLRPEPWG